MGDVNVSAHEQPPRRRRKKRATRVAVFRPSEPVLRISADATTERPPRAAWGYCAVSGSSRSYAPASNNRSADRLLVCDNWLGSNEQLLVGCIEGHGYRGPQVADWVALHAPSALTAVAEEQARERRARALPSAAALATPKPNQWVKNPTATRALTDLIGMLPTELAAEANAPDEREARRRRAAASVAERAVQALAGTFDRLHNELVAQWQGREPPQHHWHPSPPPHHTLDTTSSGASLCLVVVRGGSLHVAHAGACRAVVGRRLTAVAAAAAAQSVQRFHGNALAKHLERGGGGEGGKATAATFAPVGSALRLKALQLQLSVVDVAHPPPVARSAAQTLLRASTSAPAFPNLPPVIEAALWYPTDTYGKPDTTVAVRESQGLREGRAALSRWVEGVAAGTTAHLRRGVALSPLPPPAASQRWGSGGQGRQPQLSPSIERADALLRGAMRLDDDASGAALGVAVKPPEPLSYLHPAYHPPLAEGFAAGAVDFLQPPAGWESSDLSRAVASEFHGRGAAAAAPGGSPPRSRGRSRALPAAPAATPSALQQHVAGGVDSRRRGSASVLLGDTLEAAAGAARATSPLLGGSSFGASAAASSSWAASGSAAMLQTAADHSLARADPRRTPLAPPRAASAAHAAASAEGTSGGLTHGRPAPPPVRSPFRSQLVSDASPMRLPQPTPAASAAAAAALRRARSGAPLRERIEAALESGGSLGQQLRGSTSLGGLPPPPPSLLRLGRSASSFSTTTTVAGTGRSAAAGGSPPRASSAATSRAAASELPPSSGFAAGVSLYREDAASLPVYVPVALTVDHRPDRPDEAARIMELGGRVFAGLSSEGVRDAVPRVYGSSGDGPGLAVSRCLGFSSAVGLGVTHAPETATHVLQPEDRFLLLATDGVWAVISSDEAVAIVGRVLDGVAWGGSSGADAELGEPASYSPTAAAAGGRAEQAAPVPPPADILAECAPSPLVAGLLPADVSRPAGALRVLAALAAQRPAETALQRDACPLPAHPSPTLHGGSNSAEARVCVGEGPAPVAGCGGGGDGVTPLDLADSLLPPAQRQSRLQRRRCVALVAAEAVVAAARAKWVAVTAAAARQGGHGSAAGPRRRSISGGNPDPDRDRGADPREEEAGAPPPLPPSSPPRPDSQQSSGGARSGGDLGGGEEEDEEEPILLLQGGAAAEGEGGGLLHGSPPPVSPGSDGRRERKHRIASPPRTPTHRSGGGGRDLARARGGALHTATAVGGEGGGPHALPAAAASGHPWHEGGGRAPPGSQAAARTVAADLPPGASFDDLSALVVIFSN